MDKTPAGIYKACWRFIHFKDVASISVYFPLNHGFTTDQFACADMLLGLVTTALI